MGHLYKSSSSMDTSRLSSLHSKVVLITGASSGIGAGTALYLATLGCRLSLVGRNVSALENVREECRKAGAIQVMVMSKDLGIEEECIQAVQETVDHYGRIDVMVHSAGILVLGSIETLSTEDYDRVMNMNTRAAFLLTKSVMPHLFLTRGNIVHISSLAGIRALPSLLGYCMSKAALDMLTRTVALEVADRGVRVNAVNPGVIDTPIFTNSGMGKEESEKLLEKEKLKNPLGRVGNVRDVAETVAFLASDSASFITGQTLA